MGKWKNVYVFFVCEFLKKGWMIWISCVVSLFLANVEGNSVGNCTNKFTPLKW